MKAWLVAPKNELISQYVECYWFIKTYADDEHQLDQPKLNPDACGHLIITPEDQPYQFAVDEQTVTGSGSHWLFPYNHTYTLDHSRPTTMLGIKFHAGALYSVNTSPNPVRINEISAVSFAALIQQYHDDLNLDIDALLAQGEFESQQCAAQLDSLILPWLQQANEDKHSALIRKALALKPEVTIAQMGQHLHCSQRTLERSFLRVTGMTLKQCQSINKLDMLLTHLSKSQQDKIDWSDVALQFGFSDQPHLIRYLKSAIGNTPSEYVKQRDFVVDIYGDYESS
ncbi:helix-turn-helix domain-containing protein [Shewanella sp. TC10]|uniref:helix-turn-helix domain-containing protein n=1 Tax=Shewanella sp. TC10 TaxID=1419739 RepID=UPI00129E3339|nr:AraC family transcriptional regulator [Shewanella sp. TC10]